MMTYGISFSKTQAIFLSHLHVDAFAGIFGLTQTMNLHGRTEELKVFGPVGTRVFFEKLFSTKELAVSFPISFTDCSKGLVYETDCFSISSFPVEHGVPAVGYAIEEKERTHFDEKKAREKGIKGKLFSEIMNKKRLSISGKTVRLEEITFKEKGRKIVFSGDTRACREVEKQAKEADLLIHDSTFSNEDEEQTLLKYHSTAFQAAKIAKKARVKRLVLTHLSNRYEDKSLLLKEAKSVFANTILAEEGLEIKV